MWFRDANRRVITALRKHNLIVDLHVHAAELVSPDGNIVEAPYDIQVRHVYDIITSAIQKSMDVVGIVGHDSFQPGEIAKKIVQENRYDLKIFSGVEVASSEKISVIVYEAQTIPKIGESIQNICYRAHKEHGFVMAVQPYGKQVHLLNKIVNTRYAPDFVEIYNEATYGGYIKAFIDSDIDKSYTLVINSAAKTPKEFLESEMMSRVPRKKFVELGVMTEDEGVNYIPNFIRNDQIRRMK